MQPDLPLSLLQTALLPGTEVARRSVHWSFARVCGGVGYLLDGDQTKSLAPDDLIMIPAGGSVRLRASQLSALALCHFEVCPAELPGLFPVAEVLALAEAARDHRVPVQVLPAGASLSRQFAALCGLRERTSGLVLRGEMLRLAAHALQHAVRAPQRPASGDALGQERFRQLLAATPSAELMEQPASELAHRCGCSERHFRRLFKQQFGVSLRTWQIQLRLRKAARLLRASNAKVLDVALESGFQHLGQFNAAFKRLLGTTPSAWRRSRAPRKQARAMPAFDGHRGPHPTGVVAATSRRPAQHRDR